MTKSEPVKRTCEICGLEATRGETFRKDKPTLVSLCVTIYRRAPKRQLVTCKRVTICERCLTEAISLGQKKATQSLAALLFDRIVDRYNTLRGAGRA